ncbi:spore coat protein [Novisyntrophococcus fermenticellae]|uniref:spore coat protein n=1 Tax=Novisyntrophococcus fermenticellae TaxID=2068655 RepID=UPI001E46364A|nr:spore coat protein [Novisyntrophococcus fermenticellae]
MMEKQKVYSEKEILTDALTAEKATTNNYNTFANECVHEDVRQEILHCLEQEHAIQQDVFCMMHDKGYYPTPAAQEQKVQEAKQKFSQCVKNSSMM